MVDCKIPSLARLSRSRAAPCRAAHGDAPERTGEKWGASEKGIGEGSGGGREGGGGSVFARKWTRIGALCENEKVTKAEGKNVHIYA